MAVLLEPGIEKRVRILDTEDFGYTTVTVNHPLRDEAGNINLDKKGNPKPDPKLKDTENIPLKVDVDSCFADQVRPRVRDAWMDRSKDRIGTESPTTQYDHPTTSRT